ncbi:InlB B-repeat-containing protein, partial [Porphyromonas uenonis]
MTKRILYPIVFALLLLLGGWSSKASGQSSGATYAVRYTLPKGVSDLRCVTTLPSKGKEVVTSGRKLPAGTQLTFTATVEAGYEIDHWMVNGEPAQHKPNAYGGAKKMEMEMPQKDIDVIIVMKQSATRLRSSEECIVTLESSAGGHLSALYVDFDPFEQEEQEVNVESGDAVPKNITLEVTAIPDMWAKAKIGKWYQDGVAISGSEGSTRQTFVIRKDTKIKVDFEVPAKPFEGYTVTLPNESPEGTIDAYYEDDNFNHVSLQSGENKVPKWKYVFLTATPKAGYEFSYWTLNGERADDLIMKLSDNSCKFEPDADVTVGAVFKSTAPAGHKITLTAGEGGTLQCFLSTGTEVQSGSTVDDGVDLQFTATPKSGYKTDQWTINGEPFAKGKGSNTITQKADKDLNVEVSFLKDIELYTVEYAAEEGGTIKSATYYDRTTYNYVDFQSGKELPKDSEVDIEVEPKAGYVVDLWYLNDQPIDGSKGKTSQTIKISDNSKIRITFATKPKQTVTYTASTGGTIQGTLLGTAFDSGSKLDEGSYIIFTATPSKGYEVDQWRIDGEVVTRYAGKKEIQERLGNKPLKVEVSFKKIPVTFPVVFTAGEGGTIVATVAEGSAHKTISSGDALVQYSKVTFTAKPKSGYLVDQWTVNDQPQQFFAGKPELTRSVREALKVHVTFKEDKPAKLCTINYTKENEWGTLVAYYDTQASGRINVKPGDKVEEGYMITFLATPKEGYTIDHWTYNGTKTPTVKLEMLTVTAKEDMTVAVVCNKAKLCTVTFDAVSEGGKMTASYLKDEGFNGYKDVYINSGEQVPAGTEVTFVVTLTEGYTLEHWLVNNTKKACDKYKPLRLRELAINEDTEVKAVYKAPQKPQHAVTFTAGEGGAIAATVGTEAKAIQSKDQVEQGAVITFTATPKEGY